MFSAVTPIFRVFDEAKAREFYVDFLGFDIAFEHRFGENFPLYLGASKDGCEIHLSEHYGDASPGAHVRIKTKGLAEYAKSLRAKNYRYAKPGPPEAPPWGGLELTLTDPFGNKLTFYEA